jgi:flagellar basal body rod protein FlgG
MKSQFKRKDKVQSVHYGQGTVIKVESDQTNPYPVMVLFGTTRDGVVRYYTRDGKYDINEKSDKDITLVTPTSENNTVLSLNYSEFRVGSRVQHRITGVIGEVIALLNNGAEYPVLILWDFHKNAQGLFRYGKLQYSISTDWQGKRWSSDVKPIVNLTQY